MKFSLLVVAKVVKIFQCNHWRKFHQNNFHCTHMTKFSSKWRHFLFFEVVVLYRSWALPYNYLLSVLLQVSLGLQYHLLPVLSHHRQHRDADLRNLVRDLQQQVNVCMYSSKYVAFSQTAKTLGSTSIRHRSDEVSDRCLIDLVRGSLLWVSTADVTQYPYPSGLLNYHDGNQIITSVIVNQPWGFTYKCPISMLVAVTWFKDRAPWQKSQ